MPLEPEATLGLLVQRLARRLGYSAHGTALGELRPLLVDFLQDSQDELIIDYREQLTRVIDTSLTLQPTQSLYDVPNDADPLRLNSISIRVGNKWVALHRGILTGHRDLPDGQPLRWEYRHGTTEQGQIEILPVPVLEYPTLLDYYRRRQPFSDTEDENHRATVDSRLVFLFALWLAKSHYKHGDAQIYEKRVAWIRRRLRAAQHRGMRYVKLIGSEPRRIGFGHQWRTQAGETIVDINVLLSETGDYLVPEQ
jgi:hypothetical protein